MTHTETDHDVVVIGGGITGCACARELAPDHDVLVLERGHVAGEATGQASGLISIVHDYPDRPAAARHAVDFFEAYDGTGDFSYTRRHCLSLVDPDRAADARAAARRTAGHGFDVAYLDRGQLEARYPGTFVTDAFVGAIEYREGGWVDPYTLTVTLQADAEDAGARVETGVTATRVIAEDGEVRGVETDAGPVRAPTVVAAAGWYTRDLVAEHVALPLRPFRYQTVNLATDRPLEAPFPIAWEPLTGLYWRPEHNGDLHVGGGTYFVAREGERRSTVTGAFRDLVADVLPAYVTGLDDARIVGGGTCPTGDAATPDGYPVLDAPAGAPDGLVVATGLHGFGIMAAPVTGAAVRALVTGEAAPFPIEPFALDRFATRSTAFSSDTIAEPDAPRRGTG